MDDQEQTHALATWGGLGIKASSYVAVEAAVELNRRYTYKMIRIHFLLFLLGLSCSLRFNSPPRRNYVRLRQFAVAEVGDLVVAEVDDIGGSVSDPIISLKVIGNDGPYYASMTANSLTLQQRMVLQTGAIVKVTVTNVEGDNIQVNLGSNQGSSSLAPSSPPKQPLESKIRDTIINRDKRHRRVGRSGGVINTDKETNKGLKAGQIKLNNLKCGMKLNGVVTSCTQYAAFVRIEPKVMRASKGDRFVEVTGLMHVSDMEGYKPEVIINSMGKKETVFRSKGDKSKSRKTMHQLEDSDDDGLHTIISRDKKLDVYVKEVWKNSGRFTLTIDSTINKSKILELKERVKNDGLERRRARRLRRQLAHVATGDTVSGVVGGINDNGDIIVTITSLGALNISGIITKHDLPKQFEVPPDLKMNFQKQLLAQDFVCGRSITCGVINVNQNIGQKASHHLRLMFEEFGALPTDNDSPLSAVLDSFEVLNEEDTSLLSKIQNDDENDERDDDVKEIYEELKGASSNLTVENFKSWGDLLDMIEEGSFEMKTLDNALNKVGATDILEFDQFAEVLEILQDSLDGLDSNDDMDDDDMDDDGMEGDEYLEDDITEQIIAQRKVDNRSGKIITAEKNEDFDDLNQEEGNFTKIASEMYDELKGSSMSLSVAKFKAWSDVKEMLDAGVFTEEDLDAGLRAVGTTNEVLNYDQFLSLVQRLDDIAILSDNEDTDGLDEWNVKDAVEVLPNSKGFARNEQSTTTRDVDENNDHALDLSENELQESLVELYNDLKGSDPQLSVKSFLEWDDLLEMKQLDLIDDEIIHNILKETGVVDSKYLSLKQFISMITMLDDIVETTSNNDEDLSMHEVDEIDRLEQPKEGETLDKDTLKEIYRDLGEVVTLESIKAWEDLVELREEGIIDDDTIEALLEAAGIASSSTVTFEGFSEFARLLEETVDAVDKNDSSLDLKDAPLKGMESSDEDENVLGLTDEEFNEMTQEIFDALRGKAKTVSIKKFLAWDDLKGMIDDGLVSKNQIELFATQVGASDHLTFEQFKQVFNKIDEVTSDSEADTKIFNERLDDLGSTSDSLEISEIYDELKSGDMLTVQEFMNWEDVTDIMKLGILKKETLSEMLSEVGAETELSLDQFGQLFQLIEDSMSAADEGTGYLMTEDGDGKKDVKQETKKDAVQEEELTHEELEQMALDIFDGLRGKKKNVVTAKKLMKWEGISDAIADGLVTKTAVQKILAKFDVANTNEFTFDQFKLIMDEIEEVIDSNYDNQDERSPELTTGKGFGANTTQKQKDSDYETSIDDADKVTQEIFDDLRGANTLLPVQTFKEWDDMTDLIENGSIKRSAHFYGHKICLSTRH